MSSYANMLGVDQSDNRALYDVLNACQSADEVVTHLKENRGDLSYVLERLPPPADLDRDLAGKLITILSPEEFPKLKMAASFLELNGRVEKALQDFNVRPNRPKLNGDLLDALFETIKNNKVPMTSAFVKLIDQKKVRYQLDEKALGERVLKEILSRGDLALADMIRPTDLEGLPVSAIEHNLAVAIELWKRFPSAKKTPLIELAKKMGANYLKACEVKLVTGDSSSDSLNAPLLSLNEVVPEEIDAIRMKLIELVGGMKESQFPSLIGRSEGDTKSVLTAMASLTGFLSGPPNGESFIGCLIEVNSHLNQNLLERGRSNLWLGALVEECGRLFESSGVKVQQFLAEKHLGLGEIDQIRQLIDHISTTLDKRIEIEVEMNTKSDMSLANLLEFFPDEDSDVISRQLGRIKNPDIFQLWLSQMDSQTSPLAELVTQYLATGMDG